MVEEVAKEIGVTININSPTGGDHAERSFHHFGQAVDINRVNGQPVGPNNEAARRLQKVFQNHPNVGERFGLHVSERTSGGTITPRPGMVDRHRDHIRVSGQR